MPAKTAADLLVLFAALTLQADWPPTPSVTMAPYQGIDIALRYPENWSVGESFGFIYLTPEYAFVNALLAYGMIIGTFDPQVETTLADATDQVIAQFREWNQNVSMVQYKEPTRVDGHDATVVELTNTSPAGGMETDLLVVVLRPNGLVTYFVGVVPDRDSRDYGPAFDRILTSVRFLH